MIWVVYIYWCFNTLTEMAGPMTNSYISIDVQLESTRIDGRLTYERMAKNLTTTIIPPSTHAVSQSAERNDIICPKATTEQSITLIRRILHTRNNLLVVLR